MRLLRSWRSAGRPLPALSPDDVVDFQITEALIIREREEDKQAAKEQQSAAQEKETGKAGHRDPDFVARARAQEGG